MIIQEEEVELMGDCSMVLRETIRMAEVACQQPVLVAPWLLPVRFR